MASPASAKLEEGDVKEALRLLISTDALAPTNSDTYAALLSLHPEQPADRRAIQHDDSAPMEVTAAVVKAALMSFRVSWRA